MKITRRKLAPATASLAALGAAPAFGQQTNENVKWRLTASFPKSLDTLWGASATIARVVGEMTDGKFVITPFAAGEMAKSGMSREAALKSFMASRQPSGRFVAPAGVAALVTLLCGPGGADIAGAAIPIDGGRSAA